MATAGTDAGPLALYLPPTGSAPVVIICLREQHTKANTLTDNPVEQGAPITDHSRPEADRVQLDCLVSKASASDVDEDTDPDALWQQLDDLHNTPSLIRAVTIGGDYDNMGVENVSRAVDVKTANALAFTLSLRRVRVVKNKMSRVVVSRDPRAQSRIKRGKTTTKDTAAADNRTAAAKLADGFAGHRVGP